MLLAPGIIPGAINLIRLSMSKGVPQILYCFFWEYSCLEAIYLYILAILLATHFWCVICKTSVWKLWGHWFYCIQDYRSIFKFLILNKHVFSFILILSLELLMSPVFVWMTLLFDYRNYQLIFSSISSPFYLLYLFVPQWYKC